MARDRIWFEIGNALVMLRSLVNNFIQWFANPKP
jgi:hypothetical protein